MTDPPRDDGRMPWGKFQGVLITELPDWYLKNAYEVRYNLPWLSRRINHEFHRRRKRDERDEQAETKR